MFSIRNSAVFSRENRFIPVILRAIVITFLMYRVFSLDIFAVSPNDTVSYLMKATSYDLAKNPVSIVQPRGYKYAGYPLFLMAVHQIGRFVPIDPLTLMALAQRLLLATTVGLLFWRLGAISIPLALYLSSGVFLAQSNILYSEGLSIPLALGFALSLIGALKNLQPDAPRQTVKFWIYAGLVFASFYALVLVKVNYIVFALPLIALTAAQEPQNRKLRLVNYRTLFPIAVLATVPFLYMLAITLDNYKAYDQLTPVLAKERVMYWGVWNQVFTEHPENKSNPALAQFYDNGSPYPFLHGVEKKSGGYTQYRQTLPIFKKRVELLIEKSDISLIRERTRTFGYALLGGSKQELGWSRDRIMGAGVTNFQPEQWSNNIFVQTNGLKKYYELFNRGKDPTILRVLPSPPRNGGNGYRVQQAILAFFSMAAYVWMVAAGKARMTSLASLGLVSYLMFCGAASLYFTDIWRYIVTGWTIFAVLVFYQIWEGFQLPKTPK